MNKRLIAVAVAGALVLGGAGIAGLALTGSSSPAEAASDSQKSSGGLQKKRTFGWRKKGRAHVQMKSMLAPVKRSSRSKRCLLYTSPSPRDQRGSRMPSSA